MGRPAIHGHKANGGYSSEYIAWQNMKARCNNPRHAMWRNYGGRGIRVCRRWMLSFVHFLADMGRKPRRGWELDRIDNSRGYYPSNCRWVSRSTNQKNRRERVRDKAGRYTSKTRPDARAA